MCKKIFVNYPYKIIGFTIVIVTIKIHEHAPKCSSVYFTLIYLQLELVGTWKLEMVGKVGNILLCCQDVNC